MSKFGKTVLIISLCCLLAGGIIYGIGLISGGKHHFYYSFKDGLILEDPEDDYVTKGLSLDAFDKINIDTDMGQIEIEEGDSFYVEYRDFSHDEKNWNIENGCFTYSNHRKNKMDVMEVNLGFGVFNSFFRNNGSERYVRLTVPKGTQLSDVTAENSFGGICISGLAVNGNMDVNSDCGNIELNNITANELTVNNNLGNVNIAKAKVLNADMEVDSGELVLVNVGAEGSLNLSNNLGNVQMDNCTATSGEFKLDSGNITINHFTAKGHIFAENHLGSIDFYDSSIGSGSWDVDSGNINARLLTVEDNLTAKNNMGEIYLEMKDGLENYSYECETSLGNVIIEGDDKGSKEDGGNGKVPLILENDCGNITLE